MKKKYIFLLLIGICALPGAARSQSLWKSWRAARTHDPEFQTAKAALRAARTERPRAFAALLPKVRASANRVLDNQSSAGPQFYGNQIVPVESSANTRTIYWQLQLVQPLFDWSAIKSVQAANLSADAAAAKYQYSLSQLASKVVTAYLNVLTARANLSANVEAASAFAEQYNNAHARYQAGLSGIIGANASRAALATSQADVLSARRKLTDAENTLAALTGEPTNGNFPALPVNFRPGVSGTLTSWLQRARNQNPELAALRLETRAARARVGAAESGYMPSLSLAVTHSHQSQSGHSDYAVPGNSAVTPSNFKASSNTIALKLKWSLFSGGATHAAVARASATADEAAARTATRRLDVKRDVKSDFAALQSDADVIQRLRAAVTSATHAVSATRKGIPAGVRTADDLVTQRERLLAAEEQLNNAIATAINDEVALSRAVGDLTPGRIRALSRRLTTASAAPPPTTTEGAR